MYPNSHSIHPLTKPAKPIACGSWGRLSSPTGGEEENPVDGASWTI